MATPKIRIPAGLPFRFATSLGEMELRKGPVALEPEVIPNFLELAAVAGVSAWRLGEDDGLSPGYESVITPGYELVDLANPACEKSLRVILEALATAPGVETIAEEVPLSL
jgi:hypothetical protein